LTYSGAVAPPAGRPRSDPDLPLAHDPKALNWLLRRAVRRYRAPVTAALEQGGFSDLPQQGIWAVSALAQSSPGLSGRDLVARMGISKQAVSQLIETLVATDYVARHPSPDDRRRTLLRLTARGRGAARTIDEAAAAMETEMLAKIGRGGLSQLYRGLLELDET
jgi:DNA-binding MarR family transcriptional regulator